MSAVVSLAYTHLFRRLRIEAGEPTPYLPLVGCFAVGSFGGFGNSWLFSVAP
jgi:hypothetical protein